jgi:hypothetical protein
MRGCLSVLLLAVLFAGAGLWFGGRPAAAFLIDTGLTSSGFTARERQVEVEADPPFELAGGRADSVRIRASDAEFRAGLSAQELDMTVTSVDLLGRSFERVTGNLSGAALDEPGGGGAIGPFEIEIDGPADAAEVAALLPADALLPVLRGVIEGTIGVQPANLRLEAPDLVTFTVGPAGSRARILVEGGDLAVRVAIPGGQPVTLRILHPPAAFRLATARVGPDGLRLTGALDVEALAGL